MIKRAMTKASRAGKAIVGNERLKANLRYTALFCVVYVVVYCVCFTALVFVIPATAPKEG